MIRGIILSLYACMLAAACLVVPWAGRVPGPRFRGLSKALEYAPIWAAPEVDGFRFVSVDYGRLGLELVALTIVAGVALFLCGFPERKTKESPRDDSNSGSGDSKATIPAPDDPIALQDTDTPDLVAAKERSRIARQPAPILRKPATGGAAISLTKQELAAGRRVLIAQSTPIALQAKYERLHEISAAADLSGQAEVPKAVARPAATAWPEGFTEADKAEADKANARLSRNDWWRVPLVTFGSVAAFLLGVPLLLAGGRLADNWPVVLVILGVLIFVGVGSALELRAWDRFRAAKPEPQVQEAEPGPSRRAARDAR